MPPPTAPTTRVVSSLVEDLLAVICVPPPAIVDLDLPTDDDDDDDDIQIVPLTNATIMSKSLPLPASQQNTNPDSDDEVLIVSENLVDNSCQPSRAQPTAIDIDELEDTETAQNAPLVDAVVDPFADSFFSQLQSPSQLPDMQDADLYQPPPEEDDEVVVCETKPTAVTSLFHLCRSCNNPAPKSIPFSRCKHRLCPSCHLRAIACFNDDKRRNAATILPIPVCTSKRCAAPLALAEVFRALAPPLADHLFSQAYQDYLEWRNSTSDHPVVGPSVISFPGYDPVTSSHLFPNPQSPDISSTDHPLLKDDFASAVAPLWVWDDDTSNDLGAWVCTACGEYGPSEGRRKVVKPPAKDPAEGEDVELTNDSAIPDCPQYPHCFNAHAFAVEENLKGLAEARDPGPVKRRRSSRKKSETKSSKRYRSASSIRSSKRQKVGFAKGTGYAGRRGAEWRGTSSKILEQTARRDSETTYWLSKLRCFLMPAPGAPYEAWPGFMRLLLRENKLVHYLASILITESIMDVQERVPVFVSALRVAHALAESPSLRALVTEPYDGGTGKTIAELVDSLSQQAAFLTSGAGAENLPTYTNMLVRQIRRCIRVVNRHNLLHIAKTRPVTAGTVDLEEEEKKADTTELRDGDANSKASQTQEALALEAEKKEYIKQMGAHRFQAIPGLAGWSTYSTEARNSVSMAAPQGKRLRRIAGEVASLCSSLPLSWSSSILLRVDEDRYDFLRACIFGPEDTPYDSGAFIFDIYLPPEYPNVPPRFRLLTTGNGSVRFNPNLYSNGKVCLSLLGTWSGPSWNSASTILQVLVSIQSLIFVSDPYFNEPGYESQMGTDHGKQQSARYNDRVKFDVTIHAIQSSIKHPLADFREGILTHFRLKRRYLMRIFRNWFPTAFVDGKHPHPASTAMNYAPQVTADPTLQPLSHTLGMPAPSSVSTLTPSVASLGHALSNIVSTLQPIPATPAVAFLSSFEQTRNFGAQRMTYALMQKIVMEIDSLASVNR